MLSFIPEATSSDNPTSYDNCTVILKLTSFVLNAAKL